MHPETLAAHRAQRLMSMLPNALAFGLAEVDPEAEPLKVISIISSSKMPITFS